MSTILNAGLFVKDTLRTIRVGPFVITSLSLKPKAPSDLGIPQDKHENVAKIRDENLSGRDAEHDPHSGGHGSNSNRSAPKLNQGPSLVDELAAYGLKVGGSKPLGGVFLF
ncbi:hypothetical protein VNO77_42180 [Canavalia gladiata]|uniref:Uncharacterized protein n=1 Tax=Canavalia gladiata TaxID=3824 RepID=A0AAN9K270_CANGL